MDKFIILEFGAYQIRTKSMTNNHTLNLDQIVACIKMTDSGSLNQICDAQFKFRFMGEGLSNKFEYTAKEVIGKNLSEIESPVQHLSMKYRNIHQNIITNGVNEVSYLTVIPELDYTIIHNSVTPLIENNTLIGIYIKAHQVNSLSSFISIKKVLNNSTGSSAKIIKIVNQRYHSQLTEREELILYLIILGKFDKEIADILSKIYRVNLSRDAIAKCVSRRLYQEFDVVNRSELIIAAYEQGIAETIPKLILQNHNIL